MPTVKVSTMSATISSVLVREAVHHRLGLKMAHAIECAADALGLSRRQAKELFYDPWAVPKIDLRRRFLDYLDREAADLEARADALRERRLQLQQELLPLGGECSENSGRGGVCGAGAGLSDALNATDRARARYLRARVRAE